MQYDLNTIVEMKKQHSCQKSKYWIVIRVGTDIRIKCLGCGQSVLMSRFEFESNVKKVVESSLVNEIDIIDGNAKRIFEENNKVNETKKLLSEFEKNDIIQLQQFSQCPRIHMHNWNAENKWIFTEMKNDLVILKCTDCGYIYRIPTSRFYKCYLTNKSLNRRYKKIKNAEKRKILKAEEQAIKKDKLWQTKRFKKILKAHDTVMLNENYKCYNCNKAFYKIQSIPQLISNPVVIKCESCLDMKNNFYDLNLAKKEISEEDSYDRSSRYVKERLRTLYCSNYESRVITCPNCNNDNAKFIEDVLYQGYYKVLCINCNSVKAINLGRKEFLNAVVETDNEKIMELKNISYQSLLNCSDRLILENAEYTDISEIIGTKDLIYRLQLIDSSNNHVTRQHIIKNMVVRIAYKTKIGTYKLFKYICHYCVDCGVYFDFYNSFLEQLNEKGINIYNLILKISKTTNISSDNDTVLYKIPFVTFNNESLLHSFGYKVGFSGISEKKRHKLLKSLYEQKVMSIAEMKSTINRDISLFIGREGYEMAINDWQNDLSFLNKLIDDNY